MHTGAHFSWVCYPRVGYRVGVYWVLLGFGKPFFKEAILTDTSASTNGNSSCPASSPRVAPVVSAFTLQSAWCVLSTRRFSFASPWWTVTQSNFHGLVCHVLFPLFFFFFCETLVQVFLLIFKRLSAFFILGCRSSVYILHESFVIFIHTHTRTPSPSLPSFNGAF